MAQVADLVTKDGLGQEVRGERLIDVQSPGDVVDVDDRVLAADERDGVPLPSAYSSFPFSRASSSRDYPSKREMPGTSSRLARARFSVPRSIFARRSPSRFSNEAMLAWAFCVRRASVICIDRRFRSSAM